MKVKQNIHIIVLFFVFVTLCNICCNSKSDVFRQLEGVEALIAEHKDSVAAKKIESINAPTDTTADLALYNYLRARLSARNHNNLPSNILDYSIDYFKNTNDSLRLAYAYNYKARFLLNEDNKKEARITNVAAEKIAEHLNNHILNYNIYSIGYYIAAYCYDNDECIFYANKAYITSRKLDDASRMAYAAVFLTMCYEEKDMPDSTKKYMAVCLNYINNYDELTKSIVCQVFGDVLSKSDDVMAERYYKESISIRSNADAYNGLTRLYLKQNKMVQADTCFQKALRPQAYENNIKLMNIYADKLQSIGDMAKAVEILNQISATKDSLYEESCTGLNNRLNILADDIQQAKDMTIYLDCKLLVYRILLLVFILSTATLSIWAYRHKNIKPETTKDVTLYEQPEPDAVENTSVAKIDKELEYGKQLYEKMIVGSENISQLKKEQRMSIVKYYESIDSEYIGEIKSSYEFNKLSLNYVIVLILQHIGKDKNFVINTMGFTDQAMRSLKSRMEKFCR